MAPRRFRDPGHSVREERRTDVSQTSISTCLKIPGERVLSVDAVMEVARDILWPDVREEQR